MPSGSAFTPSANGKMLSDCSLPPFAGPPFPSDFPLTPSDYPAAPFKFSVAPSKFLATPFDFPVTPSDCPASAYDFFLPGYEFAPPGYDFVFTGYEFLPSLIDCGPPPEPQTAKSDCGNRQIKQRRQQIIPRRAPIKWGSRPIIQRNGQIKWGMVKFIHRRHVRGQRNHKIIRIGPVLGFPPLFGSSRRLPGSRRARELKFPVDAICQRR
jgi:hypothetical protein